MGNQLQYEVRMNVEIAKYFYDRFVEYVDQNPEEADTLTYGTYLGEVVLGSLKALFEGKVPEVYNPTVKEKKAPTVEDGMSPCREQSDRRF